MGDGQTLGDFGCRRILWLSYLYDWIALLEMDPISLDDDHLWLTIHASVWAEVRLPHFVLGRTLKGLELFE